MSGMKDTDVRRGRYGSSVFDIRIFIVHLLISILHPLISILHTLTFIIKV